MGFFRGTALSASVLMLLWTAACKPSETVAQQKSPVTPITGIDISNHQGEVDFDKVKKAGVSYVFIKATQGNTFQDPLFRNDFDGASQAGLAVGAYHFYMTDDDPRDQFKNYVELVSLGRGHLPPVVDIEALSKDTRPEFIADLQIFLDLLEEEYGAKPIIYSGKKFAKKHLEGFSHYPLWLAEYEVEEPSLPTAGWNSWTFWQWTQSARVDGIDGPVDGDRFNGDHVSFQGFLLP